MEDNDKICLCFGVTKRQIEKFIRLEKPLRHSQISECYGAGTGCGWCRPFLKKMFELNGSSVEGASVLQDVNAQQYARQRSEYRRQQDTIE